MIGLVITTYNRPELLADCLESVAVAQRQYGQKVQILIVDDASTDNRVFDVIKKSRIVDFDVVELKQNKGIKHVLLYGIQKMFINGAYVVINLDPDSIVSPDFFDVMFRLHTKYMNGIVSGFHSTNRNNDGSERHPIVADKGDHVLKSSFGGINMMFTKSIYATVIEPALLMDGNWDYNACKIAVSKNVPLVCPKQSVVQHTGIKESVMGHAKIEEPDVATGFYRLHLPNVTLIGVDCNHVEDLVKARDISVRDVKFGAVKMLTSQDIDDPDVVKIPHIGSKEAYNEFIVKQLYKCVDTDYLLIFQHDGYVLNWKGWCDEFFDYDYIGATWWYKDGMNVGNGGFSLRTRKFMEVVAKDDYITDTYPEDHVLCRKYREHIEAKHGMKYAWEDVANKFSIEGYNSADKKYNGQFGFHGYCGIDYSGFGLAHIPKPKHPKPQQGRNKKPHYVFTPPVKQPRVTPKRR
jgi:hypothetical protein